MFIFELFGPFDDVLTIFNCFLSGMHKDQDLFIIFEMVQGNIIAFFIINV